MAYIFRDNALRLINSGDTYNPVWDSIDRFKDPAQVNGVIFEAALKKNGLEIFGVTKEEVEEKPIDIITSGLLYNVAKVASTVYNTSRRGGMSEDQATQKAYEAEGQLLSGLTSPNAAEAQRTIAMLGMPDKDGIVAIQWGKKRIESPLFEDVDVEGSFLGNAWWAKALQTTAIGKSALLMIHGKTDANALLEAADIHSMYKDDLKEFGVKQIADMPQWTATAMGVGMSMGESALVYTLAGTAAAATFGGSSVLVPLYYAANSSFGDLLTNSGTAEKLIGNSNQRSNIIKYLGNSAFTAATSALSMGIASKYVDAHAFKGLVGDMLNKNVMKAALKPLFTVALDTTVDVAIDYSSFAMLNSLHHVAGVDLFTESMQNQFDLIKIGQEQGAAGIGSRVFHDFLMRGATRGGRGLYNLFKGTKHKTLNFENELDNVQFWDKFLTDANYNGSIGQKTVAKMAALNYKMFGDNVVAMAKHFSAGKGADEGGDMSPSSFLKMMTHDSANPKDYELMTQKLFMGFYLISELNSNVIFKSFLKIDAAKKASSGIFMGLNIDKLQKFSSLSDDSALFRNFAEIMKSGTVTIDDEAGLQTFYSGISQRIALRAMEETAKEFEVADVAKTVKTIFGDTAYNSPANARPKIISDYETILNNANAAQAPRTQIESKQFVKKFIDKSAEIAKDYSKLLLEHVALTKEYNASLKDGQGAEKLKNFMLLQFGNVFGVEKDNVMKAFVVQNKVGSTTQEGGVAKESFNYSVADDSRMRFIDDVTGIVGNGRQGLAFALKIGGADSLDKMLEQVKEYVSDIEDNPFLQHTLHRYHAEYVKNPSSKIESIASLAEDFITALNGAKANLANQAITSSDILNMHLAMKQIADKLLPIYTDRFIRAANSKDAHQLPSIVRAIAMKQKRDALLYIMGRRMNIDAIEISNKRIEKEVNFDKLIQISEKVFGNEMEKLAQAKDTFAHHSIDVGNDIIAQSIVAPILVVSKNAKLKMTAEDVAKTDEIVFSGQSNLKDKTDELRLLNNAVNPTVSQLRNVKVIIDGEEKSFGDEEDLTGVALSHVKYKDETSSDMLGEVAKEAAALQLHKAVGLAAGKKNKPIDQIDERDVREILKDKNLDGFYDIKKFSNANGKIEIEISLSETGDNATLRSQMIRRSDVAFDFTTNIDVSSKTDIKRGLNSYRQKTSYQVGRNRKSLNDVENFFKKKTSNYYETVRGILASSGSAEEFERRMAKYLQTADSKTFKQLGGRPEELKAYIYQTANVARNKQSIALSIKLDKKSNIRNFMAAFESTKSDYDGVKIISVDSKAQPDITLAQLKTDLEKHNVFFVGYSGATDNQVWAKIPGYNKKADTQTKYKTLKDVLRQSLKEEIDAYGAGYDGWSTRSLSRMLELISDETFDADINSKASSLAEKLSAVMETLAQEKIKHLESVLKTAKTTIKPVVQPAEAPEVAVNYAKFVQDAVDKLNAISGNNQPKDVVDALTEFAHEAMSMYDTSGTSHFDIKKLQAAQKKLEDLNISFGEIAFDMVDLHKRYNSENNRTRMRAMNEGENAIDFQSHAKVDVLFAQIISHAETVAKIARFEEKVRNNKKNLSMMTQEFLRFALTNGFNMYESGNKFQKRFSSATKKTILTDEQVNEIYADITNSGAKAPELIIKINPEAKGSVLNPMPGDGVAYFPQKMFEVFAQNTGDQNTTHKLVGKMYGSLLKVNAQTSAAFMGDGAEHLRLSNAIVLDETVLKRMGGEFADMIAKHYQLNDIEALDADGYNFIAIKLNEDELKSIIKGCTVHSELKNDIVEGTFNLQMAQSGINAKLHNAQYSAQTDKPFVSVDEANGADHIVNSAAAFIRTTARPPAGYGQLVYSSNKDVLRRNQRRLAEKGGSGANSEDGILNRIISPEFDSDSKKHLGQCQLSISQMLQLANKCWDNLNERQQTEYSRKGLNIGALNKKKVIDYRDMANRPNRELAFDEAVDARIVVDKKSFYDATDVLLKFLSEENILLKLNVDGKDEYYAQLVRSAYESPGHSVPLLVNSISNAHDHNGFGFNVVAASLRNGDFDGDQAVLYGTNKKALIGAFNDDNLFPEYGSRPKLSDKDDAELSKRLSVFQEQIFEADRRGKWFALPYENSTDVKTTEGSIESAVAIGGILNDALTKVYSAATLAVGTQIGIKQHVEKIVGGILEIDVPERGVLKPTISVFKEKVAIRNGQHLNKLVFAEGNNTDYLPSSVKGSMDILASTRKGEYEVSLCHNQGYQESKGRKFVYFVLQKLDGKSIGPKVLGIIKVKSDIGSDATLIATAKRLAEKLSEQKIESINLHPEQGNIKHIKDVVISDADYIIPNKKLIATNANGIYHLINSLTVDNASNKALGAFMQAAGLRRDNLSMFASRLQNVFKQILIAENVSISEIMPRTQGDNMDGSAEGSPKFAHDEVFLSIAASLPNKDDAIAANKNYLNSGDDDLVRAVSESQEFKEMEVLGNFLFHYVKGDIEGAARVLGERTVSDMHALYMKSSNSGKNIFPPQFIKFFEIVGDLQNNQITTLLPSTALLTHASLQEDFMPVFARNYGLIPDENLDKISKGLEAYKEFLYLLSVSNYNGSVKTQLSEYVGDMRKAATLSEPLDMLEIETALEKSNPSLKKANIRQWIREMGVKEMSVPRIGIDIDKVNELAASRDVFDIALKNGDFYNVKGNATQFCFKESPDKPVTLSALHAKIIELKKNVDESSALEFGYFVAGLADLLDKNQRGAFLIACSGLTPKAAEKLKLAIGDDYENRLSAESAAGFANYNMKDNKIVNVSDTKFFNEETKNYLCK